MKQNLKKCLHVNQKYSSSSWSENKIISKLHIWKEHTKIQYGTVLQKQLQEKKLIVQVIIPLIYVITQIISFIFYLLTN